MTILYAKSLCPEFLLSEYGMIGKFILEARENLDLVLHVDSNMKLYFIEIVQKDETMALIVPRDNQQGAIEITLTADNIISKKKMGFIRNALEIAQSYRKQQYLKGEKHYSNIPKLIETDEETEIDVPITEEHKNKKAEELTDLIADKLGIGLSDTITDVIISDLIN